MCTSTPFVRPSERKDQAVLDDSIFEAPLHPKSNTSRLEVSSIIEQPSTLVECRDGTAVDRSEHTPSLGVDNVTTSSSVKLNDAFAASSSICSVSSSYKQTSSSQSLDDIVVLGSSGDAKPVPKEAESTKSISGKNETSEPPPEAREEPGATEVTCSDPVVKENETAASSGPQSIYLSDGDDSHSKPAAKSSRRLTRVSCE